MTFRERFRLSLTPEHAFGYRLLGLEAIFVVLLTLVSVFQVIPAYVTIAATLAVGAWVMLFAKRYGKTTKEITEDGWETFLDGREELGEYEELGGQYEPAADEDDDR